MKTILAIAALLLSACPPLPPPAPVPPDVTPPADAASPEPDTGYDAPAEAAALDGSSSDASDEVVACPDLCCSACVRLATLGCQESKPTHGGLACADVCRAAQAFRGIDLHLSAVVACKDVACVRRAKVACKQ